MARITAELIRKKSEHNESIMGDLEEISLHQLEIEKIEQIDTLCRKLKILYLQNNIIGKMENLRHLKDLEYLNLALNNIRKIEGLEACEFLNKLDLTVNFIDLNTFADSVENLKANKHLKELYLVGNPCCDWKGWDEYLIAHLPQVERLDGKEVTRSRRILAMQSLDRLTAELDELSVQKEEEIAAKRQKAKPVITNDDECEHSPEVRTEIYREMAEEKAEKEKAEKERLPRERDYEKEHKDAVLLASEQHYFADGRVRQCNEGKVDFRLDEDERNFFLYVSLPRFVDTSLIDCEVEPDYVMVVIKNQVLRLATPSEIMSDSARSERSTTTGELKVILPKATPCMVLGRNSENSDNSNGEDQTPSNTKRFSKTTKLGDEILHSVSTLDIQTIYKGKDNPNSSCSSDHIIERSAARQHELDLGLPALDDSDEDE